MKKALLLGVTILLLMMVSTLWNAVLAHTRQLSRTDAVHATNGAYRDGLFLGSRDAQSGNVHRVCIGRWSMQTDRAAFASGYEDGYSQAMAPHAAKSE